MGYSTVFQKNIIENQIFVSLAGTSLAVFFMIESNIIKIPTILLIFTTYICGYLYTKYQSQQPMLRKIIFFNAISAVFCAVLILHNHNEQRLFRWLVIVVLGLFYNSFFLSGAVRRIPLFKIFYVGIVWGLMNSWLITAYFRLDIFIITVLFVAALILPFDIRDMETDDIVTFPRVIGIGATKAFAVLLFGITAALSFYYFDQSIALALTAACLYGSILTLFAFPHRTLSYFNFWLEACSVVPFLVIVLIKYF